MLDGRRDDSMRRRQRVLAVLDQAAAAGDPIYRHRDLLEKIHALQADPVHDVNSDHAVTHASLRTDLLAAHERAARLNTRIHQLEKRLSEALGEHGLGERPPSRRNRIICGVLRRVPLKANLRRHITELLLAERTPIVSAVTDIGTEHRDRVAI
jgi:hypothetical protein